MIETLSQNSLSLLSAERDAAIERLRALIIARAESQLSDDEDLDHMSVIRRIAMIDFAMKGGRHRAITRRIERAWLAGLGVTVRP